MYYVFRVLFCIYETKELNDKLDVNTKTVTDLKNAVNSNEVSIRNNTKSIHELQNDLCKQ